MTGDGLPTRSFGDSWSVIDSDLEKVLLGGVGNASLGVVEAEWLAACCPDTLRPSAFHLRCLFTISLFPAASWSVMAAFYKVMTIKFTINFIKCWKPQLVQQKLEHKITRCNPIKEIKWEQVLFKTQETAASNSRILQKVKCGFKVTVYYPEFQIAGPKIFLQKNT